MMMLMMLGCSQAAIRAIREDCGIAQSGASYEVSPASSELYSDVTSTL